MRNFSLRSALFFFCCLWLTLFTPLLFPKCRLFFFAPYLTWRLLNFEKKQALWSGFAAGFVMDLLQAQSPLGFTVCNYLMSLLILDRTKSFFFADKWATLPIMTFIFSVLSTLIHLTATSLVLTPTSFSYPFIVTDFILFPLLDALFTLIIVVLPRQFLGTSVYSQSKKSSSFLKKIESQL